MSTRSSLNGLSFTFSQTYNAIGALKSVTYPCRTGSDGTCATGEALTVGYNYTNALLSSIDDGNATPSTKWSSGITYQPNGLIADVVHGDGKLHEKWTADSSGMARPGSIAAQNAAGSTLWSSGNYAFDGAGNIKTIGTTYYTYDDLQQLRTTTNIVGTSFNASTMNYDAFGNILSTTQWYCGSGKTRCGSSTPLARRPDTAHNHYMDSTYDAAGSVLSDGTRGYTWDALGMMTSTVVSGRTFDYLYDANDERVAIVEPKSGLNRTTWTLRGFDNHVLRTWVDDSWSGSRTITKKEDEIWRGSQLLASDNGTVRHYVLDHLGSARFLADANGNALGTQTFSPWGVGGSKDGGMLQFTGHERDAVNVADAANANVPMADLPDYMHARYYSIGSGFLSPDPIDGSRDHPQSWNRYLYVEDNPLSRTDPDGRCMATFVAAGGSGGGGGASGTFTTGGGCPQAGYLKKSVDPRADVERPQPPERTRAKTLSEQMPRILAESKIALQRLKNGQTDYLAVTFLGVSVIATRTGNLKLSLPNITTDIFKKTALTSPTALLSASVMFGAYGSNSAPSAERLNAWMSGASANVSAGSFFGGGVAVSADPRTPAAAELGLTTPAGGILLSRTYP